MTKKIKWANPNKMIFESGHKTFDRQTNVISTGNIIANTLLGRHIRPYYTPTTPLGDPCRPGDMQAFDLNSEVLRLPAHVRQFVVENARNKGVWVYELRHWNGDQKVIHGYIITRSKTHKYLGEFCIGPTYKSWMVLNTALPYLAEGV